MKIRLLLSPAIVVLSMSAIILACNQADSTHKDTQPKDPCTESKAASNKATSFSQSNAYLTAKANIQTAFNKDSLEHAISFGKDTNGNNITSPMSSGSGHSSELGTATNMFADIHNHPKGTPPSSGDLYGFISKALENSLYEARYIVTASGVVYAFAMIDLKIARDFVTKYPKVSNPGYQPAFPDSLVDEFNKLKAFHAATDEMAITFILEKYNTGVALLKQDEKGNFIRLNTKEATDPGGVKKFVAVNCQ